MTETDEVIYVVDETKMRRDLGLSPKRRQRRPKITDKLRAEALELINLYGGNDKDAMIAALARAR